jgi:hypothetical protein
MLLVQEYLKTKSFGDLAKEHGVYASFSKSGHKWSLNYDQLESKENDPLAQECRGLILSRLDGKIIAQNPTYDDVSPGKTLVLAHPMKRFFNYGQGSAYVDWNDPKLSVLEKLDGTLCIVYWDPIISEWCVATRSVPEADLLMDNGLYTFRQLFEKALQETTAGWTFVDYVAKLDKEITYCYELTTPLNRIVVAYPDYRITLLAARRNRYIASEDAGEWIYEHSELDISTLPSYGVPIARSYSLMSVQELTEWVSTLNPSEHEGVVVKDSKFNRIKVKNAAYVAFSKAKESLGHSERNCLELVLLGKEDDVIPSLPEEIGNNLLRLKAGFQSFLRKYDDLYHSCYQEAQSILPNNKKTFALLLASKGVWAAPFFQIWDKKCVDVRDFVDKNKKGGSYPSSFLDRLLDAIKR